MGRSCQHPSHALNCELRRRRKHDWLRTHSNANTCSGKWNAFRSEHHHGNGNFGHYAQYAVVCDSYALADLFNLDRLPSPAAASIALLAQSSPAARLIVRKGCFPKRHCFKENPLLCRWEHPGPIRCPTFKGPPKVWMVETAAVLSASK